MPASIRNHGVYGPFSVAEAVLGYFEPTQSCSTGCGCVGYLGKVVLNRSY
jgi:hypothetical protein